ncbi:MAG TPA: pyruvate oxidoreductase subunit gamma [Syntrophus sp. (in: bacteria)]|jgi:2-oxoacid:acceptor oxidoreductase gamma subunit (pyruvate/2-ketoisovalerate family)|nr:pyruvate oxidoreductase subunit gamma [Syntrophus sp. (in: bacteria)]
MYEIIWHGRGGQGVVVAAQMLAEAAYLQEFKGVTSAPTFGPERRGAPLTASTRIAQEPIRIFSQIEEADIAVVLDESLFKVADIFSRLRKGGLLIINTQAHLEKWKERGEYRIAVVDAAGIALKHHLSMEGAPIVNTPMLGAFARASGLVSLENIEKALSHKLTKEQAARNFTTVKAAYEETTVREKKD